jgi:hypothetical protein
MTELWSSVATCNVMNQGSQVDNGKMLRFCVLHRDFIRILGGGNWFLFVRCTQCITLISYFVNVIFIRPDVSCKKLVDGFRLNFGLLSWIIFILAWSSGHNSWLQIQMCRVWFPALPNFLWSSGSGTGPLSLVNTIHLRSCLNGKVATPGMENRD